MPAINASIGQAQSTVTNPFQQRSDDQVRDSARKANADSTQQTRPATVSAAKTNDSSTRNARQQIASRQQNDNDNPATKSTASRGSILDITV